jgi:hypothetical protein
MKKGSILLVISVLIVLSLVIIAGFIPFRELNVLRVSQIPEHPQPFDEITITAEIVGGSLFLGPRPSISYCTARESGGSTGSMPMKSKGNDIYEWTTSAGNKTVIWYMIFSESDVLVDNILKVGFNEETTTTPTIKNYTQLPQHPTSETEEIEIFVDIESTYNITTKEVNIKYRSNGAGGGGSGPPLTAVGGTTYKATFTPAIHHGLHSFMDDTTDDTFQKGMTIYYRIFVFDEAHNAAVSPTQILTIS